MLTYGSRFFFGLAVLAFAVAAVYGGASGSHQIGMDTFMGVITLGYKGRVGDHLGYTILVGLAFVSAFLGIMAVAVRDADPEAAAQVVGLDTVPEAAVADTPSYWPVVGAFSVAALVLGLVVGRALFIIGLLGLFIVAVEWAVKAWADRATGDAEVNRSIRNRMMYPIEVPGIAVLGIALFVFSVSRLLLAVPKGGSYAIFAIVPAIVLGIGWLIAVRPRVNSSVVAALLVVGALAVLAGGVYGAVHGTRKVEEHPSTGVKEGSLGRSAPRLPSAPQAHR